MTLIQLIVFLLVIGVVLWLINYLPMDAMVKKIIIIIVAVVLIIWLLTVVGLLPGGNLVG